MRRISVLFLMCVFCFCVLTPAAMAANQNPSLNWGYTDVMDAAIPGTGFIFNPKVATYNANSIKDGNGRSLVGTNKLDIVAFVPQLIYVGKLPFGNLKWGAQAQWHLVSIHNDSTILPLTSNNGMTGDLLFGPFIGSAHPLAKDWVFHWMAEFDTYAPVGRYNANDTFNAGANFWTFEPFLAMTLQMPYGFEFSTRQHYTWNTKNKDYVNPALTGDFNSHDMQAGDMWHMNFSLSKSLDFITPFLRFGAVGYYGQQLSNDKLDSSSVANSKERVFGIGPYLGYTYIPEGARKPFAIVSLKAYKESMVENRAEGYRAVLRVTFPF
jgi:hypothetical protein